MNGPDVLWVGLAGGGGALARYLLDRAIGSWARPDLPVGTITINITGSLVLGVLVGLVSHHGAPRALSLVAGTGFCGGYTTFSTASFEAVRLLQERRMRSALVSLALTVGGTLAAAGAGLALAGW